MRAVFTGFDSAWGERNTGAICELVLQDNGSLLLQKDQPVSAKWNIAIDRAGREADGALDVWAIDQPICVANELVVALWRPTSRELSWRTSAAAPTHPI